MLYDSEDYVYNEYESVDYETGEVVEYLDSDDAGFEVFEFVLD